MASRKENMSLCASNRLRHTLMKRAYVNASFRDLLRSSTLSACSRTAQDQDLTTE